MQILINCNKTKDNLYISKSSKALLLVKLKYVKEVIIINYKKIFKI